METFEQEHMHAFWPLNQMAIVILVRVTVIIH